MKCVVCGKEITNPLKGWGYPAYKYTCGALYCIWTYNREGFNKREVARKSWYLERAARERGFSARN